MIRYLLILSIFAVSIIQMKALASLGLSASLLEKVSELPEFIVETRKHRVLHILAYVREYSSLSTYTDTVFLFREKMVDYMVPSDRKVKFSGWTTPRVLTGQSYYRFTDSNGLDSVSDECHHHFSWGDWMGLIPEVKLPMKVGRQGISSDTLRGKYCRTEIWNRVGNRVSVDVDVLADTTGRRWVPNIAGFFRDGLDFEKFTLNHNFDNVLGDRVKALDLVSYSFDIESRGRGHDMFRFNKVNEPYYVTTKGEVYILDREYITVKEAKTWQKRNFETDEIGIFEAEGAPELSPEILELISRVDNLDKEGVRLELAPDQKMVGKYFGKQKIGTGQRALAMLKRLTGIEALLSRKNLNKNWDRFRKDWNNRNR